MTINTNQNLDLRYIARYRKSTKVNQAEFWQKFGCTQSAGSRYESDREIPTPLAMLLLLHASGTISDSHLNWAADELEKTPSYRSE